MLATFFSINFAISVEIRRIFRYKECRIRYNSAIIRYNMSSMIEA